MTRLEAALLEMAALLDELHLPYMLIGGLAVAQWGEPRATLDVDLTVWVEPDDFESTIEKLAARLAVRTAAPLEFARRTRVLPALAANGILVDLVFAAWPLERRAIEHAVERSVAGATVRVAGLDYLLFLKLVSDRPRDQSDASALLRRHRNTVDVEWLEREIATLAEAVAQPEMLERFRSMLRSFDH
jgi:hypothetical protein